MIRAEDRYDSLIRFYAEGNLLDWLKIKAQIKAESAFIPRAMSHVGAMGLGQFMPATWKEWGYPGDAFNPEANIDATCRYMRWQMKYWNQDERKALASYNWGVGNLGKCIAAYGDTWFGFLPTETSKYVLRINQYYVEYQHEEQT